MPGVTPEHHLVCNSHHPPPQNLNLKNTKNKNKFKGTYNFKIYDFSLPALLFFNLVYI